MTAQQEDRFTWDPVDDPIPDLLANSGTFYALVGLIVPPNLTAPGGHVEVLVTDHHVLQFPPESRPFLTFFSKLREREYATSWLRDSGAPADALSHLSERGNLAEIFVSNDATSVTFPSGLHLVPTSIVWSGSVDVACLTPGRALNSEVYAAGNVVAQLLFDQKEHEDLNTAITRIAAENEVEKQVVCLQLAIHLPSLLAGDYAYIRHVE